MASPTTIDQLGIDLLQNILVRLPAVDFASANGSSSLLHHVCGLVPCRPKLSSACSLNPSLQVAVEEVVNKVLSEPMRPHFAIVSIGCGFDLQETDQLITAKLGSNFPVITNSSEGFMGKDAFSEEFIEFSWEPYSENTGMMLVIGFLPGMEVKKIPLLKENDEHIPGDAMIDKFVTDIREFSTSVSGSKSPAAIIMFSSPKVFNIKVIMEKLDYDMSTETAIVGDFGCNFENMLTKGGITVYIAVALVFVKDRNKPLGIGEIQFHTVSSSGMLPLGPSYEVTSCEDDAYCHVTRITAIREGSHENLSGEMITKQAHEERGDQRHWYIGVTKRRKCSNGLMTSFAFHRVQSGYRRLCVNGIGLRKGDTFSFYLPDFTTALSSVSIVSNHLRSFKQGSTSGGDKREVFGGLIFTSCSDGESFFDQLGADSSSFLGKFPGVTLGVNICSAKIGRGDLNTYIKEFQEHKSLFSCVNEYGAAYLIMSYTP